jgi:hypothetical protein
MEVLMARGMCFQLDGARVLVWSGVVPREAICGVRLQSILHHPPISVADIVVNHVIVLDEFHVAAFTFGILLGVGGTSGSNCAVLWSFIGPSAVVQEIALFSAESSTRF